MKFCLMSSGFRRPQDFTKDLIRDDFIVGTEIDSRMQSIGDDSAGVCGNIAAAADGYQIHLLQGGDKHAMSFSRFRTPSLPHNMIQRSCFLLFAGTFSCPSFPYLHLL